MNNNKIASSSRFQSVTVSGLATSQGRTTDAGFTTPPYTNSSNHNMSSYTHMSLSQIFLVLSLVISIGVIYFQAEHTSWFLLSSVPSTNAICDKSMGESFLSSVNDQCGFLMMLLSTVGFCSLNLGNLWSALGEQLVPFLWPAIIKWIKFFSEWERKVFVSFLL